jgi:pyruvate dehydrogenase E2 component (dihydrolipoamide acetyltransferase)
MPKLSDTMTVGTLVKWLKKEGDVIKTGDMLAEVETDKATMELESYFDGTLLKIFSPAGSQLPIGAALCAIGKPGEKVEAPAPQAAPAADASVQHSRPHCPLYLRASCRPVYCCPVLPCFSPRPAAGRRVRLLAHKSACRRDAFGHLTLRR